MYKYLESFKQFDVPLPNFLNKRTRYRPNWTPPTVCRNVVCQENVLLPLIKKQHLPFWSLWVWLNEEPLQPLYSKSFELKTFRGQCNRQKSLGRDSNPSSWQKIDQEEAPRTGIKNSNNRRHLTEEILFALEGPVSSSSPGPSSRFLSQLLPESLRIEPVMR